MSRQEKTVAIFRELVGGRAARLDPTRVPTDARARIASAMLADTSSPALEAVAAEIGFHLVDWQSEAAFLVALVLYPERFSDAEIAEGVRALLIHAPAHLLAAARLSGHPVDDIFAAEEEQA